MLCFKRILIPYLMKILLQNSFLREKKLKKKYEPMHTCGMISWRWRPKSGLLKGWLPPLRTHSMRVTWAFSNNWVFLDAFASFLLTGASMQKHRNLILTLKQYEISTQFLRRADPQPQIMHAMLDSKINQKYIPNVYSLVNNFLG